MQSDAVNPKSDLPCEYLYGRVGYLYALLFVNKYIQPPLLETSLIRNVIMQMCNWFGVLYTFILKVITAILTIGKSCASQGRFKCPLMYQWHDSFYLGAAHGVSGIMYSLLYLADLLTASELNDLVRPTVDFLSTLR